MSYSKTHSYKCRYNMILRSWQIVKENFSFFSIFNMTSLIKKRDKKKVKRRDVAAHLFEKIMFTAVFTGFL